MNCGVHLKLIGVKFPRQWRTLMTDSITSHVQNSLSISVSTNKVSLPLSLPCLQVARNTLVSFPCESGWTLRSLRRSPSVDPTHFRLTPSQYFPEHPPRFLILKDTYWEKSKCHKKVHVIL